MGVSDHNGSSDSFTGAQFEDDFEDVPTRVGVPAGGEPVVEAVDVDHSIHINTDSLDDPFDPDDDEPSTPVSGSPVVEPRSASTRVATEELPAVRIEPGEIVPGTRYRVVQFIGDGGMGVVYEAEHLDLERRVALKVLHRELSQSEKAVKMFRAEARTASKVGAEQIVQLYDFAELPDGRVMFTMELLSGPTLFEALDDGPMPASRAIGILRQVCKGLSAAHQGNVIHRDIKPENVVLERRHKRADSVKILDFGIATVVGKATERQLTAGTPLYLAPELITGDEFDHRVDVYAVGCMAYEMVTGQPPFDAEDGEVATVLRKHLETRPVPPHERVPDVPEQLSRVILRCLSKSPESRYADMEELEIALCEAQLEARLATTWDDLPIPANCDPALRERLLREMPELQLTGSNPPVRKTPKWLWPAVAGASLVIGLTSLGIALTRGDAPAPVVAAPAQEVAPAKPAKDPIDDLVTEARAAAAKSFYVFPPDAEGGVPTAYSKVAELELVGGDDATRAKKEALTLRNEFAATLVRLGDAYWGREAGKAFAVDYYKQALVFDRTHARALERAELSPKQIAAFEVKAAKIDFTDDEIKAAEPLAVLAEPDKDVRRQKLAKLDTPAAPNQKSPPKKAALLDLANADVPKPPPPKPKSKPEAEPEPAPEEVVPDTPVPLEDSAGPDKPELPQEPVAMETDDGPNLDSPKFAGKSANQLATQALRYQKQGKSDRAKEYFAAALAKDPNNVPALEAMIPIASAQGRKKKAIDYAKRLAKAQPGQARHHLRLGDALRDAGKLDDALKAYTNAKLLGSSRAAPKIAEVESRLSGSAGGG